MAEDHAFRFRGSVFYSFKCCQTKEEHIFKSICTLNLYQTAQIEFISLPLLCGVFSRNNSQQVLLF